jgi:hypothetical protein
MVFGIYRLPIYCIRGPSEAIRIWLLREEGFICVVLHNRLIHIFNSLWTDPLSENEIPVPTMPRTKLGGEVICLSMCTKLRYRKLTHGDLSAGMYRENLCGGGFRETHVCLVCDLA